jgi:predicted nuclease with TOPRIM domain
MSLKRNREDYMEVSQKKSKIKDKYTEISSKNTLLIIVDRIEKYDDKIKELDNKLKSVEEITSKYKNQLDEIYKYLGVNSNACPNYTSQYIS